MLRFSSVLSFVKWEKLPTSLYCFEYRYQLPPSQVVLLCYLGEVSYVLPRRHNDKEFICQYRRHRRHGFDPWVGKKKKWQPTLVFSSGKFHRQRSLEVYIPYGFTKGWTRLSTHDTCMNLMLCAGWRGQ